MKKFGFPAAPVVLALILTPLMGNALQQSLQMSHQSVSIFFNRPISLALLIVAMLSLFSPLVRVIWAKARKS
jgi:putative tricarboxylic transport membrane protein